MSSTRQLAAIMFTDIVGYTALMQQNEELALKKLHRFKEELQLKIGELNGEIIQYYGDGCLIIFKNAVDAVQCAKNLQEEFSKDPKVPVRIGIHLGDIIIEEGNIFGDCVNISSRIESMGVPGAVLVSDTVKKQIKNKPEFQLTSLGNFEFKNVDEPIEIFALSNPGFPVPNKSEMVGKFKETKTENTGSVIAGKTKKKRQLFFTGIIVTILIGTFYFGYKFFSGNNASNTQTTLAESKARSIAVLPFTDMSPDKTQEYLGDGLADDIITALSGIDSLKVIGRTSSFQFKGKNVDLREIGDKLGVETVLEGSVQKAGNLLRITAQLINVKDGSHIWSQKWDRDITDIFKVQDEIANGIKDKLKISLLASAKKATTVKPEAYESFLKGRQLLLTDIPENVKKARSYFLDAIRLDPAFAEAIAFLSLAYYNLGTSIYPYIEKERRQNAVDSSFSLAGQAIALDENSAAAHLAMGHMNAYNYEWEKADIQYRKAHELSPGTIEKNFLAGFLGEVGDFNEAVQLAKDALVIDPLDVNSLITYARILMSNGRYDEAITILNNAIKIDSNSLKAYTILGHCYRGKQQFKEALQAWSKQHESYGNTELVKIYRTSDFKTSMQAWLKQASTPNAPIYSGYFTVSTIYAYFLDKENTFKFIELAIQDHSVGIARIKNWKLFDFLRDDPRYKDIYRKLRFDKYDEFLKN